jgi:hypothetical protein
VQGTAHPRNVGRFGGLWPIAAGKIIFLFLSFMFFFLFYLYFGLKKLFFLEKNKLFFETEYFAKFENFQK